MQPHGEHPLMALTPTRERHGLHVCTECGSELVQPSWWKEDGPRTWRVCLSCPECWHEHESVYAQAAVDAYDERLNQGTEELMATYRRLTRENLSDELDRFAGALRAGAILPEDF